MAIAEIRRLVGQWAITPTELEAISGSFYRERELARQFAMYRARQLVQFWEMTERELTTPERRVAPIPLEVKYRHPKTGEEWDGAGDQPQWLRQALLKEGYLLSELAPGAAGVPAPATDLQCAES